MTYKKKRKERGERERMSQSTRAVSFLPRGGEIDQIAHRNCLGKRKMLPQTGRSGPSLQKVGGLLYSKENGNWKRLKKNQRGKGSPGEGPQWG